MPARVTRKIITSGKSKCIALPPDWLRALNLDAKDTIEILYNAVVVVKPKSLKLDREFLRKEFEMIAELEESR